LTDTPAVRVPKVRAIAVAGVIAVGIGVLIVGSWVVGALREHDETTRTTTRFNPPVWAGQNVPSACSGGFYARHESTIVITIVAHCAYPGATLRDGVGRVTGVFGPMPELSDCPAGRVCAPSDFLALSLAPDRIPWGHLNVVDLGAGGYRTFAPGTRALACADIAIGDLVETDGREHYRQGKVTGSGRYDVEADTFFPCMVSTDIAAAIGDSGAAVLVNGAPAGIISREVGGRMGFTPLAEGLESLGLRLCTTPDCDLSPERAVQPS
jgi:hypothetical protein